MVGSFKAEDYVSERKMVKAQDGTMIPLSIVYKKDLRRLAASRFYYLATGHMGQAWILIFFCQAEFT